MQPDFGLNALEQALHDRRPDGDTSLIHHGDRGSQYLSTRYSERLAEAGIEPSVGSRGNRYDNALVETINRLYKAELIHRRGPWKTKVSAEMATRQRVPGSTTIGCMNPSDIYLRQKLRQTTGAYSQTMKSERHEFIHETRSDSIWLIFCSSLVHSLLDSYNLRALSLTHHVGLFVSYSTEEMPLDVTSDDVV